MQWHVHAQVGDAKQRPIDMVSEYKCSAINVDMQATVGRRSSVDELIAASSVNQGAPEKLLLEPHFSHGCRSCDSVEVTWL